MDRDQVMFLAGQAALARRNVSQRWLWRGATAFSTTLSIVLAALLVARWNPHVVTEVRDVNLGAEPGASSHGLAEARTDAGAVKTPQTHVAEPGLADGSPSEGSSPLSAYGAPAEDAQLDSFSGLSAVAPGGPIGQPNYLRQRNTALSLGVESIGVPQLVVRSAEEDQASQSPRAGETVAPPAAGFPGIHPSAPALFQHRLFQ